MSRTNGYDAVMQLAARDDAKELLWIAAAAHYTAVRMATRHGQTPSSYWFKVNLESRTARRFGGLLRGRRKEAPELEPLCDTGVLVRSADGLYSMPDPDGVARALAKLKVRPPTLTETSQTLPKSTP
jgi:hypothetical protein